MKVLLLIFLLALVLTVTARGRKPHGSKRKPNKCSIWNCKKCSPSQRPTCDECNRGFVRVPVVIGYACWKKCPSMHKEVKGTCVKEQKPADCTPNCQKCQNVMCSVCEDGYVLHRDSPSFKTRCTRKCPKGYKQEANPAGGQKCVRQCTPHCQKCQHKMCSVCEDGYALTGFRCTRKCPKGYKNGVNPAGGRKCVRQCTPNCKQCKNGFSCSVCERGYALFKHKPFRTRCTRRCPRGYKTEVNLLGGKKCVKQCQVANCAVCPKLKYQRSKCSRCKPGLYKLSAGKSDFCFSHCPSGYVQKTVNSVNVCKKYELTTTAEPITTSKPESTTAEEPTTTWGETTHPFTVGLEATTTPELTTTPEPATEPEPTTIDPDLWP